MSASTATLGEPGDLNAQPGSREWAIAVRLKIQAGLTNTLTDANLLANWLRLMEQHAGHQALSDEQGRAFKSYRAFCEAKQPWGLGYAPDAIRRLLAERVTPEERAEAPLTLLDNPGPATEEERSILGDTNISASTGGTTADYLTARIARDHPKILDRMRAGEYPSVRAAALDAGIVKPRVSVPLDPEKAAAVLARHFTFDELARAWPKDRLGGEGNVQQ